MWPTKWRRNVPACVLLCMGLAGPGQAAGGGVEPADAGPLAAEEDAASVPFLGGFLEETRVVYPLHVSGWEASGETLYDVPELGASVRYQSDGRRDRWIDVYFYPVGVVPASHLDEAAKATLREIESNVGVAGGYVSADLGPLRSFGVHAGGDSDVLIPARSADMVLEREEGRFTSAVVLLVDRLYYVKARYSVAAGVTERDEARQLLEGFIRELVPATYIGSTGRCWSPAPVEGLPAGAVAPVGARLSATSDTGGAWLVGNRVLAHDPDGDQAQALALLAMAMDGRMHPGCIGSEPHNPDVPEGSREIRMEYRAPPTERSSGGQRLLPARSGTG